MSALEPAAKPGWPRTMDSYLIRSYLARFAILLMGVASVLLALDILSEGGRVMEGEGASSASMLRYTILRFPAILSQLPPFTALLAALMTLSALNRHSEITIMQAAGLSPFRIVLPMIVALLFVSAIHFAFNETIVVDSGVELKNWEAADFSMEKEIPPQRIADAWAVEDRTYVRVQEVGNSGVLLEDVTLYQFGTGGSLENLIRAEFGAFSNGRWKLFEVVRFSMDDFERERLSAVDWDTGISPDRFLALSVKPEEVAFGELWQAGTLLAEDQQPNRTLITWLHHKIAGPLATAIMPLLAALAGFGMVRGGRLFIRIALAMALGFAFFVTENLLLAFGKFGTLPPVLAAWTPVVLYTLIGFSILIHAEE